MIRHNVSGGAVAAGLDDEAIAVAAGLGGVARAGGGAAMQAGRSVVQRASASLSQSAQSGRQAAWRAWRGSGGAAPSVGGNGPSGGGTSAGNGASAPPAWAKRMQAEQRARHHRQTTSQAIKEGDRPGAPANPDLDEQEE